MTKARVGIIGGSGIYQMNGLLETREVNVETPFGNPSDSIVLGKYSGTEVAFLPRHGRGHFFTPGEIPVQANIYALKALGVKQIISISAVGSLSETIHPLDMIIPDQVVDRTKNRVSTFFGDGIVAHVSLADPFCKRLSTQVVDAVKHVGATAHDGGTYIVIEGPAFSTRAESRLYQSWGGSVIGMTALPEAKLAREAQMCYALLACVTDYDVWNDEADDVSTESVVLNLSRNASMSQAILRQLLPSLGESQECPCPDALQGSIATEHERIPQETLLKLWPILKGRVNVPSPETTDGHASEL